MSTLPAPAGASPELMASSLHQFVHVKSVDLFYLLRRTAKRIVWSMGNHRDADLAAGNGERLDLHPVAEQQRVDVFRLSPLIEDGCQIDKDAAATRVFGQERLWSVLLERKPIQSGTFLTL